MKRKIEGTLDLIDAIEKIKKEQNVSWTELYKRANLSEGLITRWKKSKGGPKLESIILILDILGANLYVDTSPEDLLKNYSVSIRQIELIEAINSYLESDNKEANKDLEKIVTIAIGSNFSYNDLLGVFLLFLLKVKQPT